jgi:hypothetical protein
VVVAAKRALNQANVELVLPYVPKASEEQVRLAFQKVLPLRHNGSGMCEVAELYYFETVVRLHRAGERAPYTGLKPAGLDVGPIIPLAEQALECGRPEGLISTLRDIIKAQVVERFERVRALEEQSGYCVDAARAYVEAMLDFQVWAHQVYLTATSQPHAGACHPT